SPAVRGVEHVLLSREPLGTASEKFGRLALAQLQAAGVFRVDAVQAKALALGDAEGIDVFLDAVQDLSSRHGVAILRQGAAHCPGQLFNAIAPCLICDGLSDGATLLSRRAAALHCERARRQWFARRPNRPPRPPSPS